MTIFRFLPVVAITLAVPSASPAQTRIDVRTQTKSIDFSNALSTRPFKTGTTLPATCAVGEAFFKTDAAAGQNWFGCTSTNTWMHQSGSGSAFNGYSAVAFSSTPAFTAPGNHDTTFLLLLTGNVNASSLSGASAGDFLTFRICQDVAGGHAFVWPPNIQGAGPVNPTANACTNQTFVFDGSSAQAVSNATITGVPGSAITMPGSTSGTTTLQPSAVAGGTLTLPARTATVATTSGVSTANNCAEFDANGNIIDAGAACGGAGSAGAMFSTAGTGHWWPFGFPHSAGSSGMEGVPAINRVYYREFVVPAAMTVRSLAWFQANDDAGGHYTWGIYNSAKTLVVNAQCGTAASTANSRVSCTFAGDVSLTPGTYFLAYSSDSPTCCMLYANQDSAITSQILASLSSPRVFYGSTNSTGTTTITLPSSFATDSLTARLYEQFPDIVFLP